MKRNILFCLCLFVLLLIVLGLIPCQRSWNPLYAQGKMKSLGDETYAKTDVELKNFEAKLKKRLQENRKEFILKWNTEFTKAYGEDNPFSKIAEETALNMGLDKTKRTIDENIDIYIKLLKEGALNSEDFKWLVKGQYELEEMRKLIKGKINTHGLENNGRDSFFQDARRYYKLYSEGKLTHEEHRILRHTRSDYYRKYKK